jgi:hypothetical protein
MANYYTYGMVPDVDETVFGTSVDYSGLGFPDYAERGDYVEPVPANRPLPEEEPVGPSPLDLADEGPSQEYNAPQPMPQTRSDQTAAPYIPPGLEAAFLRMQGKSPEQLAAREQAVAETKTEREVLSSLLQNNQFDAAFKYAMDNNVQNLLIDPTELRTLKSNFTPEETKKFFAEMPKDLMGEQSEEEVKFDPAAGLEASLQQQTMPSGLSALGLGSGVPQVQRAFIPLEQKKEDGLFEDIIKTVLAAGTLYAGASALPGLIGGGSAAGAGTAGATTAGGATATGFTPGLASAQMAASGAAGTGAAGSTGFLSGLQAAGKAILGIPETIGATVGEALGASVNSLQAKMIGNAVISGGVTGAKGGDLEDILKSAALAAGLTYVSDKAIKTIAEGLRSTGTLDAAANAGEAISSGVEVVGEQAASNIAQNVVNGLDQFTVTFSPASAAAQLASTVGALGGAQAATSVKEPTRQPPPEQQPTPEEQIAAEYTQTYERPDYFGSGLETGAYTGYKLASDKGVGAEPEREIKVTTEADKVTAKDVAAPLSSVVATQVVKPEGAFEEAPTVEGKQEIVQQATAQPADVVSPLAIVAATPAVEKPFEAAPTVEGKQEIVQQATAQQPADIASPLAISASVPTIEKPFEAAPTVEGKQEIVQKATPEKVDLGGLSSLVGTGYQVPKVNPITGELEVKVEASPLRPDEGKFDLSKLADVAALTPAMLTEGYRDLPKEKSKTEKELDKIQADLAAASTTPSSSFLKDLIDKYGSVENALKLLGALGSAFSKAPKAPTGGAGIGTGGGMGGALPKYNYARQQLSPDIDYYTYGTRPEARFFDYTTQLERPVQPELPPAKPPEPDMVMATGGLTGYAKGGSKSSRYVDGPGSGREDKIPALLSDGEYVIDAETLALLGDGSTKEGARRMDKFRANIRKHKGRALSRGRISPNAKSPDKYMGGGLT